MHPTIGQNHSAFGNGPAASYFVVPHSSRCAAFERAHNMGALMAGFAVQARLNFVLA